MSSEHRTKSPVQERATSPQQRVEVNYGHDADKQVRHIARTKQLITFPGQEGTQRGWSWVLKSLAHRRTNRGFGCPIQILDTVIYSVDGAPEALYYTKDDAVVSRIIGDGKGSIALTKAVARLRLPARYSGITHVATEIHGAVSFTTAGETVVLKVDDVQKIRKGQCIAPTGTEALVLAVPTRALCAEPLLSIQHVFNLETSVAKAVHRSFRLVTLKGIAKRIPCMSSTLNRKLERACRSVLQWIEAYSEARVVYLVLEFIEDILGELWLVRSPKCCTTKKIRSYRRQQRSPSAKQSKALRIVAAKGIADGLNILRFGHGIGESASSPPMRLLMGSNTSKEGERKQPGSNKRPYTAMSPAELGGSKSPIDADKWGFEQNAPARQGMDAHRSQTTKNVSIATDQNERRFEQDAVTGGRMCRGFAALEERDSKEVGRTAAAGQALGSSQLYGECPGDFCLTNLPDKIQQRARFEQKQTRNGFLRLRTSSEGTLGEVNESPFLRRIMKLDETILKRNDGLCEEDGLSNSEKVATSTRRGVSRRGRRCRRLDDERSSVPNRSADIRDEDDSCEWKEIPFSWIVRGRQERHLINQQLRRYHKDKRGAFVGHLSGLGESSLSLGSIFPAIYYQSARVCPSCFRVYSMMDAARSKSVRSLDAQATKKIHHGVKVHRQGDPPASKKARQGVETCVSGKSEMGDWNEPRIFTDPSSGTGKVPDVQKTEVEGEETPKATSMETFALMRAQAAIDGLTRGDICELRSFSNPPAAVNMVVAALMITLTGRGEPTAEGWLSAKRYMTDIDNLFAAISNLNLDNFRISQTRKLEAYIMNPAFRPDVIASVSLAASRLCAWVLGVLEAHWWRTGRGHPRIDTLRGISGVSGMDRPHTIQNTQGTFSTTSALVHGRPSTIPSPGSLLLTLPSSYQGRSNIARQGAATLRSRVTSILGPAVFPFQATGTKAPALNHLGSHPRHPQVWKPHGAGSGGGTTISSPSRAEAALMISLSRNVGSRVENGNHDSGRDAGRTPSAAGVGRQARSGRAATTKRRQMKTAVRLADTTAAPFDPVEFQRSDFLCTDGVTLIPYAVVGAAPSTLSGGASGVSEETRVAGGALCVPPVTATTKVLSFVVVHDFFDTMEKTFLLFKPLVRKHPGCQVLCFNSPGQAGTHLPQEPEALLTNTWLAARLDELMQHVDNMGEMPLADRPFHVLGIGYGANIASAFACYHGTRSRWKLTLKSLICINGFAAVDTQLAAVLHSAHRAFQCFPPERPDLPITFWSRFIFSEGYIKAVGSALALNILCAVANPLGGEGMLRIVRGCLNSRDLRKDLSSITVPLVLIQSTKNMLINAANVDPFLESRRARHVWSHQLRFRGAAAGTFKPNSPIPMNESGPPSATEIAGLDFGLAGGKQVTELLPHRNTSVSVSCLGSAGERALFESLAAGPQGAFVAWVKGGHEIRQECKRLVTDILELLAVPSGQTEAFFRTDFSTKGASVGRKSIAAKKAKAAPSTEEVRCVVQVQPSCGDDDDAGEGGRDGAVPEVHEKNISSTTSIDDDKLDEKIYLYGGSRTDSDTLRDPSKKGGRRGRSTESGRSKRQCEMSTPEEVVSGDPTGEQRSEPSTPGYTSLRNFRGRQPFPEVPKRCGTRTRSPSTKVRPKEAARSRYRSHRALLTNQHFAVRSENSPSQRERPGADGTACRHGVREETLSPPDDSGDETLRKEEGNMGKVVGEALSLEETIADFDNALRGHRKQRGVLRAVPAAFIADGLGIDGGKHNAEECCKREKENATANSWLDGGATSWATVPPVREDLEDLPWRDEQTKGRSVSNDRGEIKGRLDQELNITRAEECHGETGETAAAFHDVELDGTFSPRHRPLTAAAGRRLLNGTQTMSKNVPDQKLEVKQGLVAGPEPRPVGETGERDIAEASPIQVEIIQSKENAGSESPEHAQKSDVCNKMLWDGQPYSKYKDLSEAHETLRGDARNASASYDEAFGASVAIGEVPDQLGKDARLTRQVLVPSAAGEANIAREAELDEVPVTPSQSMLVAALDIPLHAARAVASSTELSDPISTTEQRRARDWIEGTRTGGQPPPPLAIALAETELAEKVDRLKSQRAAVENAKREAFYQDRMSKFNQEQHARASAFVEEDCKALAAEEQRLIDLRHKENLGRLQHGAEFEELEKNITHVRAATAATDKTAGTVRGMRPQHYFEAEDLPEGIKKAATYQSSDKVLDEMESLEMRAKATGGGMSLEEFNKMEQRQCVRQVERLKILHCKTAEKNSFSRLKMASRLQLFARSIVARKRVARLRQEHSVTEEKVLSAIKIQSLLRGHLIRMKVVSMRRLMLDEVVLGTRATTIQKVYRGRLGRAFYTTLLKDSRALKLQRVIRGFLGRRVAKRKRALLARFAARASSATKLQSAWRGKMARNNYLHTRCVWLASREIQRVYRGHIGRRAAKRRMEWQATKSGAERFKLGMRVIEDTKVVFMKQQDEIAALNRAQEKAEARVSSIHQQLTASESELSVLEGEMAEIDHIERELVQLTHERDLASRGITNAADISKTEERGKHLNPPTGIESVLLDDGDGYNRKPADAYALEMHLQLKRAEREQRRQQLSAEFASTFADVSDKKQQLNRLNGAMADIEATRLRKSREFSRLQRNLMELLSEQKQELDNVREKGIQLETAVATSAAAAAATAQRARDHEAKAASMYEQTEELMKFQFMSMSLSYFSSLNMMKQMRDINADTTTAAIAGSADAAAAAAASAAAASIPSLKHMGTLGGNELTKALAVRKDQVKTAREEIEEVEKSQKHPFPKELTLWSIEDVCKWLDTLQLSEYKQAFQEGKVDGSFLAELRESDLIDAIGMEHKLHLKKLILARQKLMPLSEAEQNTASTNTGEEFSESPSEKIPDIHMAFSQARHGKKRRLEKTLNAGFDIEAEDENGNTLLITAVQQLEMPVVELLVNRGADVNHVNSSGNTALHFAMSYDVSGNMGEYLINNRADDSIENMQGLSPYDGIEKAFGLPKSSSPRL